MTRAARERALSLESALCDRMGMLRKKNVSQGHLTLIFVHVLVLRWHSFLLLLLLRFISLLFFTR